MTKHRTLSPELWAEFRAEAFAFAARIAPIYRYLRWEWREEAIPHEIDVRNKLIEMARDVLDQNCGSLSCAGLWVGWEDHRFTCYLQIDGPAVDGPFPDPMDGEPRVEP